MGIHFDKKPAYIYNLKPFDLDRWHLVNVRRDRRGNLNGRFSSKNNCTVYCEDDWLGETI